MNAGIVVEGTFDGTTYRTILPRIRDDIIGLQVRQCGGKHRLKNVFIDRLEEFQRNPAWNINSAFVIRDSDCKTAEQIEKQLQDVLSASGLKPKFRVEFFAVQCMLESWLLSDLTAIRNVAVARGKNAEIDLQNIEIAPQHSQEDKEVFLRVLAQYGLPPTPPVYAQIASLVDLKVIEKRCTYFREFMRRIKAV